MFFLNKGVIPILTYINATVHQLIYHTSLYLRTYLYILSRYIPILSHYIIMEYYRYEIKIPVDRYFYKMLIVWYYEKMCL